MRKFKFRAWDKVYKHFHEGDLLRDYVLGDFVDNPEYEVTQYTGLVDKNGKEIYEGDIYSAVSVSGLVGIVLYKKGRVVILSEDGNDYPITLYRGQVIGNIYENPELLEVK